MDSLVGKFLPALGPFALAAALLALAPATAASQGLPPARPEDIGLSPEALGRIGPALTRYVDAGQLAGFVAVVARHGKVGYREAIGRMDVAGGISMRPDAVFRIYSMTKPIIAVAVMRLADQGKLRITDPVAKYLPAFAGTRVFAGGSAATPTVRNPDAPMTIEHLLTHTAGLTYGFFGNTPVDSIYLRAQIFSAAKTAAEFADTLARLPLLFSPGSRWTYSVAIDVLGRVVEAASGRSLDRFLDDEIFRPLGMRETSFHVRAEMTSRIPVLYGPGPDGRLRASEPLLSEEYLPTGRFLSGGGGLLSTVADYLRFAQMLLNGGELDGHRVLERSTVATLMRNHLPPRLTPLGDPIVGHQGYGHGLGGVVLVDSAAGGLPGSPGIYRWWGYAGTFFWIDPKNDLIGMVWTQFIPGRAYPFEHDFQRLVYQALTP